MSAGQSCQARRQRCSPACRQHWCAGIGGRHCAGCGCTLLPMANACEHWQIAINQGRELSRTACSHASCLHEQERWLPPTASGEEQGAGWGCKTKTCPISTQQGCMGSSALCMHRSAGIDCPHHRVHGRSLGAASCHGSFIGCLHNLRQGAMSSRSSSPTPIALQSSLKHEESAFLLLQCLCQGEIVLQ